MKIETVSVWAIKDNDMLMPRIYNDELPEGDYPEDGLDLYLSDDIDNEQETGIIIDSDHIMLNIEDMGKYIPISSGLKTRDYAIILKVTGKRREGENKNIVKNIGFFVTHIDPDGSGVLVKGDDLENDTLGLLDDSKFVDKLIYLQELEPGFFVDVNLFELHHIVQKEIFKRKVNKGEV